MKQLLWLSRPENEGLLDGVPGEDTLIRFHDVTQAATLKTIVKLKTIDAHDTIVIDLIDTVFTDEDILQTVWMLRRMTHARLVFLAPPGAETDVLYGRLAAEHIRDLIRLEDDAHLASVLRPLLCPDEAEPAPAGFADRANNIQRGIAAEVQAAARPLSIPDGNVLTVAVAGTMPRIGTTTQAIMLCRFVQSLGTQAIYLDPADRVCNLVHAAYAQGLEHLQVAIAPLPGFSGGVQVVDMGVLDADNLTAYLEADVRVLVTGIKPWELLTLATAKQRLAECEYITLVSFAGVSETQHFRRYIGEEAAPMPYTPELFGATSVPDDTVYRQLVLPRMQEVCCAWQP